MSAIATLFKWIMTLAAIVGSIESIVRLAKFAWNLVLKLTNRRGFGVSRRFARFGFAGA